MHTTPETKSEIFETKCRRAGRATRREASTEDLARVDTTEYFVTKYGFPAEAMTMTVPWGTKWETTRDFYFPENLPEWNLDGNPEPANPEVHAEWIAAAKLAVSDWRNYSGWFHSGRHT